MQTLLPEYTDVLIDSITCDITKQYSNKPSTYFCNGKAVTVNLKWPEGKSGYSSARSVNILTAYKKAFGEPFNGSIVAKKSNTSDIYSYTVENGKITNSALIQTCKEEYYDKSNPYSWKVTDLGKLEYENLFIR